MQNRTLHPSMISWVRSPKRKSGEFFHRKDLLGTQAYKLYLTCSFERPRGVLVSPEGSYVSSE